MASAVEMTVKSRLHMHLKSAARLTSNRSKKQDSKRQRRASESVPFNARKASLDNDSDEEPTTAAGLAKKAKAEAAQTARQVESHEKEIERVKSRAEAAGRRQERAGRRRVDEDPAEETPKPSASTRTSPPPSSQPTSPPSHNGPEKVSHKKGAGKKTKKLGNNQYTRNKDAAASSPHGKKRNELNNQGASSGDEQLANGDSHHSNTSANATNKNSPDHVVAPKAKFGKGKGKAVNGNGGKHEEPAELTLANMKRGMDAMAAFITRAQLDIAGDRTPSGSNVPKLAAENASLDGLAGGAVQPASIATSQPSAGSANGKKFEEMTAMEMADVVSRSITSWHGQFAHLA